MDEPLNSLVTDGGALAFTIATANAANDWHAQVTHNIAIVKDETYTICFKARSPGARAIKFGSDNNGKDPGDASSGYGPVFDANWQVDLEAGKWLEYTQVATAQYDLAEARLTFNLAAEVGNVTLDNINVYKGEVVCPKL